MVDKITEAAQCYLRARADLMPTVIVLDDLHWADSASRAAVERGRVGGGLAALITCLLRPDKDAPSWSAIEMARSRLGARYTEILLEPLDAAHSEGAARQPALHRGFARERA